MDDYLSENCIGFDFLVGVNISAEDNCSLTFWVS